MSALWVAMVMAASPARGVDGGLSMELVRDVIEWHSPEVNACFAGAGKRASVRYRFEVRAEGSVARFAFLQADRIDGPKVTCVGAALEKWRFPERDGGSLVEWDFSQSSLDAGVQGEPEFLSPEQIPAAWVDSVSRCYDGLLSSEAPEGRVALDLVVSRAGAVLEASVSMASPAIAETTLAMCIEDHARSWSTTAAPAPRKVLTQWLFASTAGRARLLFLPTAPAREIIVNQPKTTPARGDGLEKAVILAEIRQWSPKIRACYEAGLRSDATLTGLVKVDFMIGPEGHVLRSVVMEDTIHHETTTNCILEVVNHMKFPRPQGGGVVNVSFPWLFKTAGE